ncbi:MAG: uracil phosphoribosyltransferase [Candidatus Woesearchaeota archaeon]
MKINTNPIIEQYILKARDPNTKPSEFQNCISKIGEYLALDVTKILSTTKKSVKTILEKEAIHNVISEQPILVVILRAGLMIYEGVKKVFPESEAGFIGEMRNEQTLKSKIGYSSLPNLREKIVIICETMIATGGSILEAIKLIERQKPKKIIIIGAIASKQGIDNILKYNNSISIFIATIDPEINNKGFIVPGLGDAGDRAYGEKTEKFIL